MAAVSTWNEIEDGQLLSVIETNINTFNNSVETQVNSNTTNIATLQGTVGTNTSNITTLTTTTGTHTTNITALEGRLDIVEPSVLALQNKRQVAFLTQVSSPITTYSLTSTATNITAYTDSYSTTKLTVNATNGTITTSADVAGPFEVTFTVGAIFAELSSTRVVYVELYNNTAGTSVATMGVNIPRSTTVDSESLTAIFTLTANTEYILRMKSDPPMDLHTQFISFSMKYVGD